MVRCRAGGTDRQGQVNVRSGRSGRRRIKSRRLRVAVTGGLVVVALVLLVTLWPPHNSNVYVPSRFESSLSQLRTKDLKVPILLSSMTTFQWDKVGAFDTAESVEKIDAAFGMKLGLDRYSLPGLQDGNYVIFVSAGRVVAVESDLSSILRPYDFWCPVVSSAAVIFRDADGSVSYGEPDAVGRAPRCVKP
jgi:hypothetical protein